MMVTIVHDIDNEVHDCIIPLLISKPHYNTFQINMLCELKQTMLQLIMSFIYHFTHFGYTKNIWWFLSTIGYINLKIIMMGRGAKDPFFNKLLKLKKCKLQATSHVGFNFTIHLQQFITLTFAIPDKWVFVKFIF